MRQAGPGRPKGQPKSGGRQKGVTNLASREIKELCQGYGPEICRKLWELFKKTRDADIKLRIGHELLNRGYGKPAQALHHSDHQGGPLRLGDMNLEELKALATRLEHTLAVSEPVGSHATGD